MFTMKTLNLPFQKSVIIHSYELMIMHLVHCLYSKLVQILCSISLHATWMAWGNTFAFVINIHYPSVAWGIASIHTLIIEAPESFRHLGWCDKFYNSFHGLFDVYGWQVNPLQPLPHCNDGIPDILKVMFQFLMIINVGSLWQPCLDLESCHSFQVWLQWKYVCEDLQIIPRLPSCGTELIKIPMKEHFK